MKNWLVYIFIGTFICFGFIFDNLINKSTSYNKEVEIVQFLEEKEEPVLAQENKNKFCYDVVDYLSNINTYKSFKIYLSDKTFSFDFDTCKNKEQIYTLCTQIHDNYKEVEDKSCATGFASGINLTIEQLDKLLFNSKFCL